MQDASVKALIRARAIARNASDRNQAELLKSHDQHHETIKVKLRGAFESNQFWNFSRCGAESIFKTCKCCGAVEEFDYQCSLKWCPRCQWKITARRQEILRKWASRIAQPKHLVLTQKNFQILTPKKIREHQKNLAKIRRTKSFRKVLGGSVSVEITNEQNGWHLHSHWLLDVRWLDMAEISQVWGKLCGQEFAIVKVMDCRNTEYLQEVTKYVVEGSEMAKWPAEQVLEFVTAIKGRRFFFPFGSLFKLGKEIRKEVKNEKPKRKPCECGANDFTFESEEQATLNEIRQMCRRGGAPVPAKRAASSPQPDCKSHTEPEGSLL